MKPDWKDAPEWATWLAQDANGKWFWFDKRPAVSEPGEYWISDGAYELAEFECETWRESLEIRP